MRGDRPALCMILIPAVLATPHARGSTCRCRAPARACSGYPACAGIDLANGHTEIDPDGLPRMRGDRPVIKGFGILAGLATPHARGSTRIVAMPRLKLAGYPACAGIDL